MKPILLLNTTIMGALPSDGELFSYTIRPLTADEARQIVSDATAPGGPGVVSYVGHAATCSLMSTLLGCEVPENRAMSAQAPGQDAIALKLKARLPEGVILDRSAIEVIGYELYLIRRPSVFWVVRSDSEVDGIYDNFESATREADKLNADQLEPAWSVWATGCWAQREFSMGREVRMVPAWWLHPQDARGHHVPLRNGSAGRFEALAAEYAAEKHLWDTGEHPGRARHPRRSYEEYAGPPPLEADFMLVGVPDSECTKYQLYENTSEGTPKTPLFETLEEVAAYAAENVSVFAHIRASKEDWMRMLHADTASLHENAARLLAALRVLLTH